jgi:tetratricopeptide (TPR) repeat protein
MQGTALTLPAVAPVKEVKKEKTPQIPTDAKTAIGKEPKQKKKRSPWPFVAAGVLLTICCVFVFFAIRENRVQQTAEQEPEAPPTEVVDIPPPEEPGPQEPEPEPPRPEDELPPEVVEAQRRADENPQDPFLRLELALVFWDVEMYRPAYETLNHAAELGGEDIDFLIHAGNEFHAREAWIGSAAMYLRAYKRFGIRGDVPEEIVTSFHESVYMAAPDSQLEATYPLIEEVMRVDQPIGLVAQARHAFYNGRFDEAQVLLNKVKQLEPNMYEAALLEAEINFIEERYDAARLQLQPLMADLNVPMWIRIMAEVFFNQIP